MDSFLHTRINLPKGDSTLGTPKGSIDKTCNCSHSGITFELAKELHDTKTLLRNSEVSLEQKEKEITNLKKNVN